ncbi:hypothetical protein SZN_06886 [Streptomyces zinciresistens K42]|uniref:Uncharacterized protein n=1 Tax=Streptomyces zinciresistens K42 TaxID=700597 RepID=G2G7B5_9ACTN|nr:hypothetical protein SZN_06886 [Streptomyces zinciresistens K42]
MLGAHQAPQSQYGTGSPGNQDAALHHVVLLSFYPAVDTLGVRAQAVAASNLSSSSCL